MLYNITHMPQSIEIGYTGETQFRTIEIDLSAWMEIMPNGVPSIVHIRPGESESDAYITATEFENNILTWTVNNSDIGEHEGTGLAQVWLEETENETLEKRGMSLVFSTIVRQAVSGSDIETPAAQVPWLQQMTQLKTETVTASIEAKNALSDAEAAKNAAEVAAGIAIAQAGQLKFGINESGHLIMSYTDEVPIAEEDEENELE